MLTLNSKKPLIIFSIIVIIILSLFIIPFRFEYKIHCQGQVQPAKEWIIFKGTDAAITSVLTDHLSGINSSYSVAQFVRGDVVQFSFSEGIKAGAFVYRGDTVGTVYSSELEREMIDLKNDIALTRSTLIINLSGEKKSLVKQEQEKLNYALQQAEEHKKILNRLKALFERGLVSQEEYEIAQGTAELNEINIAISKAALESVETGEKPEMINYFNAQITNLEKELSVLEKRYSGLTLISPISGTIDRQTNNDTLLVLNDVSDFVIIIPVNVLEKKFIRLPLNVDVYINNKKQEIAAELVSMDNKVRLLNGIQVIVGSIKLSGNLQDLMPGMMVDCYISLGSFSAYEYLNIVWERLVN